MFELFVEKRPAFRSKEAHLKHDLEMSLGKSVEELRMIHLYYSSTPITDRAKIYTLSEPVQDESFQELMVPEGWTALRVELLPGQFDQRAYWANRSLEVLGENISVRYSTIYLLKGILEDDLPAVRRFFINPVEMRQRALGDYENDPKRSDADLSFEMIPDFFLTDSQKLVELYSLAMNAADMDEIKAYFTTEGRAPTWTELKVIDTYWSDHCRHTTFLTELTDIDLSIYNVQSAKDSFETYEAERRELSRKPRSLMDLALLSARKFSKRADSDVEISEEINACSIVREVDGKDFLVMFKNETHNHPTEIEPFGGAATCLGGAIRDPLSGRSYIYQSMRLTGASDPRSQQTIPGKLPQKTICKKAADGFSSYGNQIGLATGYVHEFYHPGFRAKRMEVGFVIGSALKEHVRREEPRPGHKLLLLGGDTGRDGIGGASGSSKSHKSGVLEGASSEVQKGNAPEERKLQRYFRRPDIGPKIIRCNDFGAGGVSVAFGEIADGLHVELDKVPVKYEDIYAWELAISESQERMAIVVEEADCEHFMKAAEEENLQCVLVGEVNDSHRFLLTMDGRPVVDLSRDFLNSTGARRTAEVRALPVDLDAYPYHQNDPLREELNAASQQNLMEQFDGSIGTKTVLNPYGGKFQKTPVRGMVSHLAGAEDKDIVSVVGYGYDPYIASWSPYHGGEYAVLESIARVIALGADLQGIRLTFQEYFEKLGSEKERWAKPFLALLGANRVLDAFGVPSIGGKDSMSGSYNWEDKRIDVPPTLISFAVNTTDVSRIISPELKGNGVICAFEPVLNDDLSFDLEATKKVYEAFEAEIEQGNVLSAAVVTGSLSQTILEMAIGNGIGAEIISDQVPYATIIAELKTPAGRQIGRSGGDSVILPAETIELSDYQSSVEETLSDVYSQGETVAADYPVKETFQPASTHQKQDVRVLLPVFPGTNCEDDMARAFERAGAISRQLVFRNRPDVIHQSLAELAKAIDETDILALSGGFSAADEPEGSAKFITAVFQNEIVKNAFHRLIERGGLVLGICNGFQALIKLGVFENEHISDPSGLTMGLTYNEVSRHQAKYIDTVAQGTTSPWLAMSEPGAVYPVPVSHGEGRFFATEDTLRRLTENGQIATRYKLNPNGSMADIEGIVSPSGQIFGKMAHNERAGVAKNIYGHNDMKLFESAVNYLKGNRS